MEHQNHYFTMQSIPMVAACNPLLSPSDKILYASLYFLKNTKNGSCFASNEYLADYNQVSTNTIEKSLKKLNDLNYIERDIKKILIKEARGPIKNKYTTKRLIKIKKNPFWDVLQDLWNFAFPQKNEKAKKVWYELKNGLNEYKKNINMEEIQTLMVNMVGTHKNLWSDPIKNYGCDHAKIMGILKSNIKKKDYKKDTSVEDDEYKKNNYMDYELIIPEETKIPSKINGYIKPSHFNKFYKLYPKKVSKGKALTTWEKLCNKPLSKRPKFKELILAVKKQSKSKQWQNKKYIPHPSTWLNNKKWLDELEGLNENYYKEDENKDKPAGNRMDQATKDRIKARTIIQDY